MTDDQDDFEKKLAAEQAAGFKDRMENSPPIGAGSDGKVSNLQIAQGYSGPQAENCHSLGSPLVRFKRFSSRLHPERPIQKFLRGFPD